MIAFCTYVIYKRWRQNMNIWDPFVLFSFFIIMACLLAFSISTFYVILNSTYGGDSLLLVYLTVGYPTLVLICMAFMRFVDNGRETDEFTNVVAVWSSLAIVTATIATFIMYSTYAGVLIIVVITLSSSGFFLTRLYKDNGNKLPDTVDVELGCTAPLEVPLPKILFALVLLFGVFGVLIALYGSSTYSIFIGFSVSWGSLFLFLLLYSVVSCLFSILFPRNVCTC